MNTSTKDRARDPADAQQLHFLCAPGGSRAILAGAGALLLCEHAGIVWKSLGGLSGGAIPTLLIASGMSAKAVVRLAMALDFSNLVTREKTVRQVLRAYSLRERRSGLCPPVGLYGSDKLGELLEGLVPFWPSNFWTLAVARDHSVIVFSDRAVVQMKKDDGGVIQWSDKPAPIGIAVRGSCAVPGILHGVGFESTTLHDGGLGPEGRRPVSVPRLLYGAKLSQVVVLDVGPDPYAKARGIDKIWKLVWGSACVPTYDRRKHRTEDDGLIVIQPQVTSLGSFDFKSSQDRKWQAVMVGIAAALNVLEQHGLIPAEKAEQVSEALSEFALIEQECKEARTGELTQRTEALLQKHELI